MSGFQFTQLRAVTIAIHFFLAIKYYATAALGMTLQQIAAQLEGMRKRTPRGSTRWHPSSVRNLLLEAERCGVGRQSMVPR